MKDCECVSTSVLCGEDTFKGWESQDALHLKSDIKVYRDTITMLIIKSICVFLDSSKVVLHESY